MNQIENHPSLPQQEIVDFCNEKGIHIMAYSPLGSTGGPLLSADPVVKIAEKRGVSASTILLSYHGTVLMIAYCCSLADLACENSRTQQHRHRQVCYS